MKMPNNLTSRQIRVWMDANHLRVARGLAAAWAADLERLENTPNVSLYYLSDVRYFKRCAEREIPRAYQALRSTLRAGSRVQREDA